MTYEEVLTSTLKLAGGTVSLSEAARLLELDSREVQRRVAENELLGFMQGGRLVIPRVQFAKGQDGRHVLHSGLARIIALFAHDGRESPVNTLCFLVRHNPLLEAAPIDLLQRGGRDRDVMWAARVYLDLTQPPIPKPI